MPQDADLSGGTASELVAERIRELVRLHPRAVGAGAIVLVALVVAIGLLAAGAFGGGSPHRTTTTTRSRPETTSARPAPVAPRFVAPTTTLAPGSSGAQVRALQRTLRAFGFYAGKVDGAYGPKTKQAVAAYQRSVGLTADGVFGPATLAKLARSG